MPTTPLLWTCLSLLCAFVSPKCAYAQASEGPAREFGVEPVRQAGVAHWREAEVVPVGKPGAREHHRVKRAYGRARARRVLLEKRSLAPRAYLTPEGGGLALRLSL